MRSRPGAATAELDGELLRSEASVLDGIYGAIDADCEVIEMIVTAKGDPLREITVGDAFEVALELDDRSRKFMRGEQPEEDHDAGGDSDQDQ